MNSDSKSAAQRLADDWAEERAGAVRQIGTHRLTLAGHALWQCRTTAIITEGGGIVGFSLTSPSMTMDANLTRLGFKSDIGVEGWEQPIARAS